MHTKTKYFSLILTLLQFCCIGLGGVVPNLDFLTDMDTSMIDSMSAQFSGVGALVNQHVDKATEKGASCLDSVKETEEQATAAYSHVYKFLQLAEKGGTHWKPERTGLILTEAPAGKGRSMWVSPQAVSQFLQEGSECIKKIGHH